MLEELFGVVTGRWGLLAVVLFVMPGGRKFLRTAAKGVIRAGLVVSERVKEIVSEVREEATDVVAEVQSERKGHAKKHTHKEEA